MTVPTLAEALAERWSPAPARPGAAGRRVAWPPVDEDAVVLVGRGDDEHLAAIAAELAHRGIAVVPVAVDAPSALPDVRLGGDGAGRPQRCRAVVCRETSAGAPLAHHDDRTARIAASWLALDPAVRPFAARETEAAVLGWLDGIASPTWVNDPWAASRAELKVRQLRVAEASGLRVPDTVVGSDATAVRELADRHRAGVVHKALGDPLVWCDDTTAGFLYTTELDPRRLATLGPLAHPGIFQQRVVAHAEVRVTVIGDRAFAVRLRPRDARRPDWRRALRDRTIDYEPCVLEPAIEGAVVAVVERLGLRFAAVDLIEDDDGPLFLEVNPAAAYRWLEVGLRLPITAALCDLVLAS